jgi:hypothetical protein
MAGASRATRATRARCGSGGRRGQATTETILLAWLMVLFFAAAYQIFLAHDQVSRAMTAVHARLFQMAFDYNRSGNEMSCDEAANVIWTPPDIPEAVIPTLRIFERYAAEGGANAGTYGLEAGTLMRNTPAVEWTYAGQSCPSCKRTRLCAGTAHDVGNAVTSPF